MAHLGLPIVSVPSTPGKECNQPFAPADKLIVLKKLRDLGFRV